MNTSLFAEIVAKYFRLVIGKITEKFNDLKKEATMLHKTMLREEYSADLNWGSTDLNHSIVAADVVALDSSLPLKKRGKIANASGTVAKIGIKYRKGEKQITDINTIIARGADEGMVASKVFDDAPKVIKAIDTRKEIMFEQALSTGAVLVTESSNDGTGVRADFGYKADNQFKAKLAPWNAPFATPLDDLRQLFNKAGEDSNTITHVYLSKKYFNFLRANDQGKLLAATFSNMVITENTLLPVPSRATFLEALSDEFGAQFHIVDNVFKIENADGTTSSVRPWVEANIVGVPGEVVGRLVYGTLAEETNPVAGVSYQKSGTHILVSKYSKTDPLEEFTAGQALCMPVIDDVASIYMLEADEAAADVLVAKGGNIGDDGKIEAPKTASTKTFNVEYKGDASNLTVSSSETFVTPTLSSGTVSLSISANSASSAPARSAVVTVTDGYTKVEVEVDQAANS